MKLLLVCLIFSCCLIAQSAAFFQWVACGFQIVEGAIKCVLSCQKSHPCHHSMAKCNKVRDPILKAICKAFMKCACLKCVWCSAKCVVSFLIRKNSCKIGGFIDKLLKTLRVRHLFNHRTEAGLDDGMNVLLKKVVGA